MAASERAGGQEILLAVCGTGEPGSEYLRGLRVCTLKSTRRNNILPFSTTDPQEGAVKPQAAFGRGREVLLDTSVLYANVTLCHKGRPTSFSLQTLDSYCPLNST